MLQGTSVRRGRSFAVKGLTKEGGEQKTTYFGRHLIAFSPNEFYETDKTSELKGNSLDNRPIEVNRHKPRLTDGELKLLKSFLKEKVGYYGK
jgi:hypothetical protein